MNKKVSLLIRVARLNIEIKANKISKLVKKIALFIDISCNAEKIKIELEINQLISNITL